MKNFDFIEDLTLYLFDKGEEEDIVSVVAKTNVIIPLMKELLDYDDVVMDLCDINNIDYDKEYILSLFLDDDKEIWYFGVDPAYNEKTGKYIGNDGFVLFYEDVSSRALIDMRNNKGAEMSGYEIITVREISGFGNDDEYETNKGDDDEDKVGISSKPDSSKKNDKNVKLDHKTEHKTDYFIDGKPCTKEEFEKFEKEFSKMEKEFTKDLKQNLIDLCDIMDKMNDIRRWLYS